MAHVALNGTFAAVCMLLWVGALMMAMHQLGVIERGRRRQSRAWRRTNEGSHS